MVLFVLAVLVVPTASMGGWQWVVGLLVILGVLVGLGSRVRSTSDHDVWEAIPRWQYDGRHVKSGGISREEQERALEEVAEQAHHLDEATDE